MTGNQAISTMFDNKAFICMVRFVLWGVEMKTRGSPLCIIVLILGCDGDYLSIIYCHIDPHCIGLWLCSSNMSYLHYVLSCAYDLFDSWRYGSTLYCSMAISLVISFMDLHCIGWHPCWSHFVPNIGMPASVMIYICILSMFVLQLFSSFQVDTLTRYL